MYKIKTVGIFLMVVLGISFASSKMTWASDDDFMIWTKAKYSHQFKDSPFTVFAVTESRFDDDATRYQLFNFATGFDVKVTKWFKPGFSIKYEKETGKHYEIRLQPQFVLSAKLGIMKFSDRNRFEVRLFPGKEARFRYRNRIKFGPKFKKKTVSFNPWISEEIFIQSPKGAFNQNRLAAGNTFGFDKDRFKFTLYYMLRSDKKTDGWIRRHVLGTELAFKY